MQQDGSGSGPPAAAAAAGAAAAVRYGLLRPLFVRLTHLGHVPHLLTHQYRCGGAGVLALTLGPERTLAARAANDTPALHAPPPNRCHPALAALSNKHFYNGRLVNGVTPAQRAGLVPGLAPLTLCEVAGGHSQAAAGGGRSSVNRAEAQLVAQLVVGLLQAGGSARRAAGAAGAAAAATAAAGAADAAAAGDRGAAEQDGAGDVGGSGSALLSPHQLGVICFFRAQAALIQQLLAAGEAGCAAHSGPGSRRVCVGVPG
jgi:hypothetical protein